MWILPLARFLAENLPRRKTLNLIIRHLNLLFSNDPLIEFMSPNFILLYPLHAAYAWANLDIICALRTRNPNDGRLELLTVHFLMLNRFFSAVIAVITPLPAFYSHDLIRNSPYWLPFDYYGVILGKFILDPAINNSLTDIFRYS